MPLPKSLNSTKDAIWLFFRIPVMRLIKNCITSSESHWLPTKKARSEMRSHVFSIYTSFLPSSNMLWNWIRVISRIRDEFERIRQILVLSDHFLSFEILVWISLASWVYLESCISLMLKQYSILTTTRTCSPEESHFDAKTSTGWSIF